MQWERWFQEAWDEGVTVSLPQIGDFIPERQPASAHPVEHVFRPPGVRIRFSPQSCASEDFATWLARREGIHVEILTQHLKQEANRLLECLDQEGSARLFHWGTLRRNVEQEVVFDSAGFFCPSPSFGLPVFFCPPLREAVSQTPALQTNKRKPRRFLWIRL
ncbi:MAG: hypothetical protein RMK52_07325 [Chitinophagales bacterium]|nr:hypothetical protein [Chitinophagales bacterium]MDW8394041.1 hypothetical protein [Chitinophagales bacterium]